MLVRFYKKREKFLQFVFCISLSAGLAVTLLGGWHVYLILTAQTTVEFHINRSERNRRVNNGKVSYLYWS
jgi:palmitoyltransferase